MAVDLTCNMDRLQDCLRWLAKYGWLSGSFGRDDGTGTFKDIDVYLPYKRVQELKLMLRNQGVEWGSACIGTITWWPGGTQVEVSELFPRYRKGPKSVCGVEFRT